MLLEEENERMPISKVFETFSHEECNKCEIKNERI